MWSSACSYGIQAVRFLAADARPGYVPIHEISDALGLSYHFMVKVLRTLTEAGLLASARGPNGGVRLLPSPDDISLRDVVMTVDGPGLFERCVLHHDRCSSEHPCAFHYPWSRFRTDLESLLASTSIADLLQEPEDVPFELISDKILHKP